MPPPVRYARSGDLSIAYQVIGQGLVSSTVRDLVAGSGFTFVDRGVPVLQVYGSTETSPVAVYTRIAGDWRRKAFGFRRPLLPRPWSRRAARAPHRERAPHRQRNLSVAGCQRPSPDGHWGMRYRSPIGPIMGGP